MSEIYVKRISQHKPSLNHQIQRRKTFTNRVTVVHVTSQLTQIKNDDYLTISKNGTRHSFNHRISEKEDQTVKVSKIIKKSSNRTTSDLVNKDAPRNTSTTLNSVQSVIIDINQDPSLIQKKEIISESKVSTATSKKCSFQSEIPSTITHFDSINRIEVRASTVKTDFIAPIENTTSIKDDRQSNLAQLSERTEFFQFGLKRKNVTNEQREKNKRNPRRRLCSIWSPCCIGLTLLLLLLLSGLSAALVAVFSNKSDITTTTVETTTATTTTATTATTTSTTDTTSTTTSATTTTTTSVTTTTSTTATTTTTSTATTTTTTSATTTTTTSVTTTTTTSETTTTTTTTTTANPCQLVYVGNSSILYAETLTIATSYFCLAFAWISPITGSITLSFELRHDPDYWFLDDVSVDNGTTEMLTNGGFESGTLSPWVRTTPNGACAGVLGYVCTSSPRSGVYDLCDGSNGCADLISQSFIATLGQPYNITFWMKSGSAGSVITANITLS